MEDQPQLHLIINKLKVKQVQVTDPIFVGSYNKDYFYLLKPNPQFEKVQLQIFIF